MRYRLNVNNVCIYTIQVTLTGSSGLITVGIEVEFDGDNSTAMAQLAQVSKYK